MKLTIQLPISGVQYSNRIIVLDENEHTPADIQRALLILKEVDMQYAGTPPSVSINTPHIPETAKPGECIPSLSTDMIIMENAQLKKSQEQSQQFMNIFKYKNPELFEEICTLVDEENDDIKADRMVDDKLLDDKEI